MATPAFPGLIEVGNIDLNTRPRVKNKDGSISTVRTIGVNFDGQEVLIPTVSDDGRIMSDQEAIKQYQQTGRHLGKFSTPAASTAFAELLHDSEAKKLQANPAKKPFDVKAARANGYSENEIANFLAKEVGFNIDGAREAGYSDNEIITQLQASSVPVQGAAPIVGRNDSGIPRTAEQQAYMDQQEAQLRAQGPDAPRTIGDRALGAAETALTLGTGATTGALGMIAGGAAGIVNNLTGGKLGIPGGFEAGAQQGAESLTYSPRTQAGQEYAGAVGDVLAQTLPAVPLTAEMAAIGRAAGNAGQIAAPVARAAAAPAVDAATAGIQRIRAAAPAIADRVERTLRRNPDRSIDSAGGSVGASGASVSEARQITAENLPVPIRLTEGQATRDPQQLRFEVETAKGDRGAALRERGAQQQEQFQKNFDSYVDQTGAEVIDMIDVGRSVETALRNEMARDKAAIRVAYKNAEKAGEGEAPVTLANVVDHLNESAPDAATAPLLNVARSRAIQLGIAADDGTGNLVPLETTIKNAERYRQAIGQATNYDAPNIRQSAIIKGAVDAGTETVAGAQYRAARRLRENFAKKYEDRAIVSQLVNRKRGSADRQVALEDTFKHSILDGTREDLTGLRRALTATGSEEGKQAWRDLQGATVNWLKEEATKNSATDQAGNRVVSAAGLDRAIKRLERGNKLDFVLGKQGAQTMRDMNDLAKVLFTAPPGVVNTSNTASVVLAALTEAGITGSVTGLPVPVLSAVRLASQQIKDRKLRARIQRSLNPPSRNNAQVPQRGQ